MGATADPEPGTGLKVALQMTSELHTEVDAGVGSRHGFRGGSRNYAGNSSWFDSRHGSWVWGWRRAGAGSRAMLELALEVGQEVAPQPAKTNAQCYLQQLFTQETLTVWIHSFTNAF